MPSFHVEMRSYRLVGYGAFALFALCAAAAYRAGQHWPAVGLAGFAAFGLYAALGAGSFTIDDRSISHQSTFGQWGLLWSEVSRAEFGPGGTLVLLGENKRFVLSPPSWWAGQDKALAAAFVASQLQAKGIVPVPSRTADYRTMKNTRIGAS